MTTLFFLGNSLFIINLFYLYIYSADSQESDGGTNTYGKQLPRPAFGDAKILLFRAACQDHQAGESTVSVIPKDTEIGQFHRIPHNFLSYPTHKILHVLPINFL